MHDVQALRRANPIAAVIADAGVELRRAGTRLVGRCPLHGDGEPSLVVYPQTQSYFCFGCQAGGDVIDFVSRQRQVGFKEAAALLNGIEVATGGPPPCLPQAATPVQLVTPKESRLIDAAVGLFQTALWRSRPALTYLALRGIDETTAQLCRLGLGHASLAEELRYRGLNLGIARSIGLLLGDRNAMIGRIIIPDFSGDAASWLTGRSLGGGGPRYLNLRTPSPVLGLSRVSGPEVILTEGPFDWLTAVQWDLPAAALAGSNVSKAALRALARFRRVFVVMDSDAAGRRATDELSSALGNKALPVELPDCVKDLNDLGTLPGGRQLFERCLAEARPGKGATRWDTNASGALPSAA
jgi:DNA primase